MSYCTLDDIRAILPQNVTIGTNTVPTVQAAKSNSISTAVANKYIYFATQFIDSRLCQLYYTPLIQVKKFTADLLHNMMPSSTDVIVSGVGGFYVGAAVILKDDNCGERAVVGNIPDIWPQTRLQGNLRGQDWNAVGATITIVQPGHGLSNGNSIYISKSSDTSALALGFTTITNVVDPNTFEITGTGAGAIFGTMTYQKSVNWTVTGSAVTVVSPGHGLASGNTIEISASSDPTSVPVFRCQVMYVDPNTFTFVGLAGGGASGVMNYQTVITTNVVNYNHITLSSPTVRAYDAGSHGQVSVLAYPDPIPVMTARLAAALMFDKLFVADQSPNISNYGKNLRNMAIVDMNAILSGQARLEGQEFCSRRFVRTQLFDAVKIAIENLTLDQGKEG
jgi:hypothetical protein